jgi:hypothetical protein
MRGPLSGAGAGDGLGVTEGAGLAVSAQAIGTGPTDSRAPATTVEGNHRITVRIDGRIVPPSAVLIGLGARVTHNDSGIDRGEKLAA